MRSFYEFSKFRSTGGVANLAPKCDCSNARSFRDMTFFVIFQKTFRNLKFQIFCQILKIPALYLRGCQNSIGGSLLMVLDFSQYERFFMSSHKFEAPELR